MSATSQLGRYRRPSFTSLCDSSAHRSSECQSDSRRCRQRQTTAHSSLGVAAVAIALVLSVALGALVPSQAQAATLAGRQQSPPFVHPVDRQVSRGFDMAAGPYGAGNRGLDYAVIPGDVVRAIGAGTVVFAGLVAGQKFVTILHPNGLRSSYSYLATFSVHVGQKVLRGQSLATSSAVFQLGVRRGDAYIDPAPLLGRRRGTAHLVATPR